MLTSSNLASYLQRTNSAGSSSPPSKYVIVRRDNAWSQMVLHPPPQLVHFDTSFIVIAIVDQPHNTVSHCIWLPRYKHAGTRVVIDANPRDGNQVPSPPPSQALGGRVPPKSWRCIASLCLQVTRRLCIPTGANTFRSYNTSSNSPISWSRDRYAVEPCTDVV